MGFYTTFDDIVEGFILQLTVLVQHLLVFVLVVEWVLLFLKFARGVGKKSPKKFFLGYSHQYKKFYKKKRVAI